MPDDDAKESVKSPPSGTGGEVEIKETYSVQEYLDDLRKVFLTPRSFMESRAAEGSLAKGFLFVFLCSLLGSIGFGLAQRQYLYIPFFWIVGMGTNYIAGCFFHLVFRLFGGTGELSDSVRTCNYTVAPCLFQGVPYVSTLAALYSAILLAVGMRAAHKISMLKAFLLVGVLTVGFGGAITYALHTSGTSTGADSRHFNAAPTSVDAKPVPGAPAPSK